MSLKSLVHPLYRCGLTRTLTAAAFRRQEEVAKPTRWIAPTGKPAAVGETPDLPFRVDRSCNRNLPVYTDYKNGRTRILTIIKKIDGDIHAMEEMLRRHLNIKTLRTRVDSLTGSITLHGNHRDQVKTWLRALGF